RAFDSAGSMLSAIAQPQSQDSRNQESACWLPRQHVYQLFQTLDSTGFRGQLADFNNQIDWVSNAHLPSVCQRLFSFLPSSFRPHLAFDQVNQVGVHFDAALRKRCDNLLGGSRAVPFQNFPDSSGLIDCLACLRHFLALLWVEGGLLL